MLSFWEPRVEKKMGPWTCTIWPGGLGLWQLNDALGESERMITRRRGSNETRPPKTRKISDRTCGTPSQAHRQGNSCWPYLRVERWPARKSSNLESLTANNTLCDGDSQDAIYTLKVLFWVIWKVQYVPGASTGMIFFFKCNRILKQLNTLYLHSRRQCTRSKAYEESVEMCRGGNWFQFISTSQL